MHVFYQPELSRLFLEGEEAYHCTKVLRMRPGDQIIVTDGQGTRTEGKLTSVTKSGCGFERLKSSKVPAPAYSVEMAIGPTRKAERNEWMVEKMTEMGVQKISFLATEHTHRQTLNRVLNQERLGRIALAAMKQSQQYFLPEINLFPSVEDFFGQISATERYIAYVTDQDCPAHLFSQVGKGDSVAVMIGPEGDFSPAEINRAVAEGFSPVSLGHTRLRTETAAVLACHSVHLAKLKNLPPS